MLHLIVNLFIDVIVVAAGGLLDAIGGYDFLPARRFIMPGVVGIWLSIQFGSWWYGLGVIPAMATLTLGYFDPGNFGRGLWVWLQCLSITLFFFLIQYIPLPIFKEMPSLPLWFFILHVVVGGVYGGIYRLWKQKKGDFWCGVIICSFIICLTVVQYLARR